MSHQTKVYNTRSQCDAKVKAKALHLKTNLPALKSHCSISKTPPSSTNKSVPARLSKTATKAGLTPTTISTKKPPVPNKSIIKGSSPAVHNSNTLASTLFKNDESKSKGNEELIKSLIELNSELINEVRTLKTELAEVKQQLTQSQRQYSSHNVSLFSDDSSLSEIVAFPNTKQIHVPSSAAPRPAPAIVDLDISTPMLLDITPESAESPPLLNKRKILIIGTSMSRDFTSHLTTLLPEYDVTGFTYPNASAAVIFDKLNSCGDQYGRYDFIFVVAGTNDIPLLCPQTITNYLELCKSIFSQTNVIICGIPYMHNQGDMYSNIFATNFFLQCKSSKYGFYYFDSNFFMSRSNFTRHGLHFNDFGKIEFCKKIEQLVLNLSRPTSIFLPPRYSHPLFT